MSNFRWFLVAVCVLVAFYAVREPLLRPNKATVTSWLNDQPIVVKPASDEQPPVVEQIDSRKVRDLKYTDGTIYRSRYFWPQVGVATYSFRYPFEDHLNSYNVDIRYLWWPRFGWIRRARQSMRISGPNNSERLAALGVKD
jgi:hypothetical protein